MSDKRINEISELKKKLEEQNITLNEWVVYNMNDNLLNIRIELINIRKMLEEIHHTVLLKD
ncbi:hypothetical protein KQY27_05760 [Methanobrevibacter sp. TMH8]|uniref:hypothetical protein n=1 Tax=Methanobrevibacter sp. TMH8 TaxID=2848611 RepID=UPI001CCB7C30|nr:hypothetical protein [Methanobrevibacter sp. TMH8]MBZ9571042.1 hypothetical protein [Methanobrevibacter sp. TMH8]